MNILEQMIGKTVVKNVLGRFNMKALDGYKTYITAGLGILVCAAGYAIGPVDLGVITIPHFELGEAVKYIWGALMAIFIRKGVQK